jgi:hypothetical protein
MELCDTLLDGAIVCDASGQFRLRLSTLCGGVLHLRLSCIAPFRCLVRHLQFFHTLKLFSRQSFGLKAGDVCLLRHSVLVLGLVNACLHQ